eukprot:TRINITY_DN9944_c0_g1_i1.p1 TRINITY_DN9944_c0_g1~~TRINITY_DN9944_c0_g1_i1.p1  ORF type:complete len:495 (-),score=102.20 TRINITY_DN9944_c0_g1_i1:459-1823(-)
MTAELDFDDVEQLLEDAARDPREAKLTRKNVDRRVSPEPDRKERKQRKSRSRDRDRDRDRERERDRDKEKDRDRDRGRDRRDGNREKAVDDKDRLERDAERERQRQEMRLKEEEEERQKAIEDATRGDRTVMVAALPMKADERDLYEFFTNAGLKVRDVQIIRDARTGRSKGVGYIEFYTQEFAHRALVLNGQPMRGHNITVQPSHAERNRTANSSVSGPGAEAQIELPMRLFVGGLVDNLAALSEDAILKLFAPFGDIEFVEVHTGFAFVQYKKASEARSAMSAMNNFQLAGQELKVGVASSDMQPGALGGGVVAVGGIAGRHALGNGVGNPLALTAPMREDVGIPSSFVALHGMFAPKEVNLQNDPSFYTELEEEIRDECHKYGKVQAVHASREGPSGLTAGTVWVRFGGLPSATNCRAALDKRWFGGRQIIARFISEDQFSTAVSISSACA